MAVHQSHCSCALRPGGQSAAITGPGADLQVAWAEVRRRLQARAREPRTEAPGGVAAHESDAPPLDFAHVLHLNSRSTTASPVAMLARCPACIERVEHLFSGDFLRFDFPTRTGAVANGRYSRAGS